MIDKRIIWTCELCGWSFLHGNPISKVHDCKDGLNSCDEMRSSVYVSSESLLKEFVPLKEFIVAYTKGKVKQKIIREHLENFEGLIKK